MNTLEEKSQEYAETAFAKALKAPWPEIEQAFAEAYIAGATKALAGQWHEIDEECKNIPPKDSVCLCRYRDEGYTVAIFDGVDEWTDPSNGETYISAMWNVIDGDYVIGDEITHWLLIPEPPKDESE